ncbi:MULTISPECIES: PP0621 family protein [unclassified Pseudomonas]|uniref:PP0621 family protein n=1 Tax=unclassified Pseudomonas TaxID=196821 RepID=UPI000BE321D7|nr:MULTISPECIES: PP0621 family protein [unclassified Pseudomonas]
MIRILFWAALIYAAFWLWRRYKLAGQRKPAAGRKNHTLTMVRCAHCGVHLPDDRALKRGEHWFCSPAHMEQGPAGSAR